MRDQSPAPTSRAGDAMKTSPYQYPERRYKYTLAASYLAGLAAGRYELAGLARLRHRHRHRRPMGARDGHLRPPHVRLHDQPVRP